MKFYRPSEALRPYVRYYWVLESDEPFSVLTFPIGCPQLIFHWKTPLYIPELGVSQTQFAISGQVNFPAHICSDGHLGMIVAVFYPHTVGMFIGESPSAFYNLEIPGDDICNRRLSDLAARVIECKSEDDGIRLIDNWLLSRISPTLNIARIGDAVGRLMLLPSASVEKLAGGACLGKRQFERVFMQLVGMNPKEYARVVRFQKAMWLMQRGVSDYSGIAFDCGYADQSHFIREFRAMSGHTPTSLPNYCAPYSDLYANPI